MISRSRPTIITNVLLHLYELGWLKLFIFNNYTIFFSKVIDLQSVSTGYVDYQYTDDRVQEKTF